MSPDPSTDDTFDPFEPAPFEHATPPEATPEAQPAAAAEGAAPFDVDGTLIAFAGALNAISSRLSAVEKAVARDVAAPAPGAEPSDPTAGLSAWVDWLATTYALAPQLDGWEQRPALTNELRALRQSYGAAYDTEASADAPLDWHEALGRCIARVQEHRERAGKPGARRTVSAQNQHTAAAAESQA